MFSNFQHLYHFMKDHSKMTKIHFWMVQRAQKEVFGHFLEFGLLDRLDVAYCDSTKCLPTFDNVTRSCKIIQRSQKCIFEWSKRPKMSILAIWSSLTCLNGLILQMMIVENVFEHFAMVTGHAWSINYACLTWFTLKKGQIWQFWPGLNVLNVQVGHVDKVKGNQGTVGTGETGWHDAVAVDMVLWCMV